MNMLFKDEFDNFENLWISGNPWDCNCELRPIYELVIDRIDEYGPKCEKPPTLQGRKWIYISRDIFVCRTEDAILNKDSVMTSTSTEPMPTTEQDDNIAVTVYNGTRYLPVDTGIPQPPSKQNWIPYTVSVLVLVFLVPVIIGVVLLKRRSFWLTNTLNKGSDHSMRIIQCRAVSDSGNSALNTADVDEEQTTIHHDEIREATTN